MEGFEGSSQDSSPHTRRYFQVMKPVEPRRTLFSAHAEVFPIDGHKGFVSITLLRTRGGISLPYLK